MMSRAVVARAHVCLYAHSYNCARLACARCICAFTANRLPGLLSTAPGCTLICAWITVLQRLALPQTGLTPVTAVTFAKWKADRAARRREEDIRKVEEAKKATGGRGLSTSCVLSLVWLLSGLLHGFGCLRSLECAGHAS